MDRDRYAMFQFIEGYPPLPLSTFSNLSQAQTATGDESDRFCVDLEDGECIEPIGR